jgi:hypothetical protein
MSTLEILPSISEKKRARSHQFASCARLILKRALDNKRNAGVTMLLLEWAVVRAGAADHFRNAPTIAPSEHPQCRHCPKCNRNFRQECSLAITI